MSSPDIYSQEASFLEGWLSALLEDTPPKISESYESLEFSCSKEISLIFFSWIQFNELAG
jgi:hypothetical protein